MEVPFWEPTIMLRESSNSSSRLLLITGVGFHQHLRPAFSTWTVKGMASTQKAMGVAEELYLTSAPLSAFFWVLESPPRVPIIIRILHIYIYIFIYLYINNYIYLEHPNFRKKQKTSVFD